MNSSTFRQMNSTRLKPGTRNETPSPVEVSAVAVLDGNNPPLDSNIAKLENQLDSLRSQVRQAQQLAGLGTAAATIAHEVNNLLTPMLSYAKIALDTDDHRLARKALEVTLKNVQTLVQMSERVLGIAAARVRSKDSVSVREAAEAAADALCRDPAKDGIRLHIAADENTRVIGDALQIRQVLFNLFLNARQAMKSSHSGRLTVEAERTGEEVHITVKDNGPGIAPDLLARIFEPLQTTKTEQNGKVTRCSGLGLALCRDLVHENHGTLTAESVVGEGTTFHIRLPAATN